jgi:Rod binding domain-containing protein
MSGVSATTLARDGIGAEALQGALRKDAGRLRISNMHDGSFYKALTNASAGERREAAESAAKQLVSSALVMPVLASMREGTFNTDGPFAPGMVEQRFAPMLDQHLADRITGAANFDLVDEIVERYLGPEEGSRHEGTERTALKKDLYG